MFNHVTHAADVCSDIGIVADIIAQLHFCYTDQLIASTKNPASIVAARERTHNDIESFVKLQYDPFDPSNAHHWKNHFAWFKREVRFIDAESATIAEEIYRNYRPTIAEEMYRNSYFFLRFWRATHNFHLETL